MGLEEADKFYRLKEYQKAIDIYKKLPITGKDGLRLKEKIFKCEFYLNKGFESANLEELLNFYLVNENFEKSISLLDLLIHKKHSPVINLIEKAKQKFLEGGAPYSFERILNLELSYLIKIGNSLKILEIIESNDYINKIDNKRLVAYFELLLSNGDIENIHKILIRYLESSIGNKREVELSSRLNLYTELYSLVKDQDQLKYLGKFLAVLKIKETEQVKSKTIIKDMSELFVFYSSDFYIIYEIFKLAVKLEEEGIVEDLKSYLVKLDRKKFNKYKKVDKELNPLKYDERNTVEMLPITENMSTNKKQSGDKIEQSDPKTEEVFLKYINELFDFDKEQELNLIQLLEFFLSNQLYFLAEKAFEKKNNSNFSEDEQIEIRYLFCQNLVFNKNYNRALDISYQTLENYNLSKEQEDCFYYLIAESYFFKKQNDKAIKYYEKVLLSDINYRMAKERVNSIEQNQ